MGHNNFSKIILSLGLVLIAGFALPQLTLAIGQMTKPIVFENVLRGQELQETLVLFNSEDKEVIYGLAADGALKNWTNFYSMDNLENPIKEIKIPVKSQINVLAKFKVPNDAPNGDYTGQVVIFTSPEQGEQEEGMSVSVGLSIGRDVSITVTDKEIIRFETTIIPEKYGVGKNEPLKIKVIHNNQGNVVIKPALQLKITKIDNGKVVQNVIYPYPEDKEAIKPFERKEFPNLITWQTAGQENGKYRAEIKILLQGDTMKEESFRFDVGVDIWALLLANITNFFHRNLMLSWFVLGGALLALSGILLRISKKPKILKKGLFF